MVEVWKFGKTCEALVLKIIVKKTKYFCFKYLEQEKISDLLKFWIQAENFSQDVQNIKKSLNENEKNEVNYENLFKQIQNDAMIVYDK